MRRIDEYDWSTYERRLIPVDGADLAAWHEPGDGTRWVLWLHGACADHRTWCRQLGAFPGFDHLYLDVRGQGESVVHTGRALTFSDVVDDIGHVLDAVGAERAVLVGHSWGGNPVQEFTHRHPERVDGLVMVGAWGQLRPMSESELRRIRLMTKAYRLVPWRLVGFVNSRACSDVPETREAVTEALLATGRDVFLDLGLTAYEEVHEVDEYPQPTPTLLLRGELDFPKHLAPIYEDIRAKNPNAREVVLPGTRHVPMLDAPEAFNEAMREFLTGGAGEPPR